MHPLSEVSESPAPPATASRARHGAKRRCEVHELAEVGLQTAAPQPPTEKVSKAPRGGRRPGRKERRRKAAAAEAALHEALSAKESG